MSLRDEHRILVLEGEVKMLNVLVARLTEDFKQLSIEVKNKPPDEITEWLKRRNGRN